MFAEEAVHQIRLAYSRHPRDDDGTTRATRREERGGKLLAFCRTPDEQILDSGMRQCRERFGGLGERSGGSPLPRRQRTALPQRRHRCQRLISQQPQ